MRKKHIFRGDSSKGLWDEINAVPNKAGSALYVLGCHCQRLEEQVESNEAKIKKLEEQLFQLQAKMTPRKR